MSRFGSSRTPAHKLNQVIIHSKEDFPDVIDSSKVYFIDGPIDMAGRELIIPEAGMYVNGHGYGISSLFSSEDNISLFKTQPGSYSGDVIITGCTAYVTGAGSMIFDLDNDGNFSALELNSVNLGTFSAVTTSLGSIANYRQIRTGDFAAIRYANGLTFNGVFSGMAFTDSILLANVAGTTFLMEGVGLSITAGLTSDMNALSLAAGSRWCDFTPSDFTTGAIMTLNGFRTNEPAAVPSMMATDPKALFKNCVGIDNTYIGAYWSITSQAETIINAIDTFVKVAGTTSNTTEGHFEAVGDNGLKYIGERNISVFITSPIVIQTNNSQSLVLALRHYDDSIAGYGPNLDERPIESTLNISGDRQGQAVLTAVAALSQNDIVEVWVKNVTSTSNPTALNQGKLIINERV